MVDQKRKRGRPRAGLSGQPNLVGAWVRLHGDQLAEAVKEMNEVIGTSYTIVRVLEWARSDQRMPSVPAVMHMLQGVLSKELQDDGLTEERINDLLEVVTVLGCHSR